MYLNKIFNSQAKTINGAAGILAISALISRFFGVISDWLLAKTFGASPELDVYLAAFRIPDLVYNILIAGGIVVVFLPLFSELFQKNEKRAWYITNNILNAFLFLIILVSLILFILTPQLVKIVAPGFNLEQVGLFIILTRLMFLSPILFGLSSVLSGILQYFNRFLIFSLCSIFYNLGIIFGILFLTPFFGILGVAIGVILGAVFHMAIQIPSAVNCGFVYKPLFNFKTPDIKKIFILMVPRTIAIAAQQINLIVITAIASTLASGSLVIFNFSNDLQYFPVSMMGISFAIAAFPSLVRSWAELKKEEFIKHFSLTFRQILYFIIPISFFMFILKNQIVNIIYRYGQFSQTAARLTAASLGLFCLGIFASSLIPLIFRAFFSFQDTKTPTLIAIISIGLNIFLSFYLSQLLKIGNIFQIFIKNSFSLQKISDISVLGLSLAFSVAAIFQFLLLIIFLYKRIGDFGLKEILNSLMKIICAGILMAGVMYFTLSFISPYFKTRTVLGLFWQIIIPAILGILTYVLTTFILKSPEISLIFSSFLKRFSNKT